MAGVRYKPGAPTWQGDIENDGLPPAPPPPGGSLHDGAYDDDFDEFEEAGFRRRPRTICMADARRYRWETSSYDSREVGIFACFIK